MRVKGLNSGTGIELVDHGDYIEVRSTLNEGETNTLGSLGSGESLVGAKSNSELKMKSLKAEGANVSSDTDEVSVHIWGRKTITADYTAVAADDKKTVYVNAGVNDVDITIPTGLSADFSQAYVHLGTGNINFVESGTEILGTKKALKTQYNQVWLEKSPVDTEKFVLLGNTEA